VGCCEGCHPSTVKDEHFSQFPLVKARNDNGNYNGTELETLQTSVSTTVMVPAESSHEPMQKKRKGKQEHLFYQVGLFVYKLC